MRTLPLYPRLPALACQEEPGLPDNPACERCDAPVGGCRHRCIPAAVSGPGVGGIMLVVDSPGRVDDQHGQPLVGAQGARLRQLLARHAPGQRAIVTYGVRCWAGPRGGKTKPAWERACRPYLMATMAREQPDRILVLGAHAASSVFGRSVDALAQRGAYQYLFTDDDRAVPVFGLIHPLSAIRNHHLDRVLSEDFQRACQAQPALPPMGAGAQVIETERDARLALERCRGVVTAFDVETVGQLWNQPYRIEACSLANGQEVWCWAREALRDPRVCAPLREWAEDDQARKVGQNTKFDQLAIQHAFGWQVRGVVADTRLQRKILDPATRASLEAMQELVGMGGGKHEGGDALARAGRDVRAGFDGLARARQGLAQTARTEAGLALLVRIKQQDPTLWRAVERYRDLAPWAYGYGVMELDQLVRYNARDAVSTHRLWRAFEGRLDQEPWARRTWETIVRPASLAIPHLERWGLPVNQTAIELMDRYLTTELEKVEARVAAHGYRFSVGSSQQIETVLFDDIGLVPIKETKGGRRSTDKESLTKLEGQHPLVGDLLEYRRLAKARGTYAGRRATGDQPATGLFQFVRDDGRVHTSILLDGAESGRTSSRDPNCQNWPRRTTVEGKMARDCFAARPGWSLLELDFSQLELRVAAMLSGDPAMQEIFRQGVDYHRRTAELISRVAWRIEPEQVESRHRTIAKTINFALLYGAGLERMIAQIVANGGEELSRHQAAQIRDAILGSFPRLARWIEEQIRACKQTGYAWTHWAGEPARRRHLWQIGDPDDARASHARNGAVNHPVQGTGSDYLVSSLHVLVNWILDNRFEDRCLLVLPVHDSLMFEVRDDFVDTTYQHAKRTMEGWPAGGVPLVVDAKAGHSWGSMSDYPPKPPADEALRRLGDVGQRVMGAQG